MRSGLVFCFWPDGVLAGGVSGLGSAPTSFSMFSEMASAIDSALSEGALTTGCTGAAGCTGGCTAAGWSACQSYGFSRTVFCGMTCGCESVRSRDLSFSRSSRCPLMSCSMTSMKLSAVFFASSTRACSSASSFLRSSLCERSVVSAPATMVALRDWASAIIRSHCACACAICCFMAASWPRYSSSFSTRIFILDLSTEFSL